MRRIEIGHGFNPLESLRGFVQRHDSLLRASQLAESVGATIHNNPHLSAIIFALVGLVTYSTYEAINVTRDLNALLEGRKKSETPLVPPTTSQLIEQRMSQLLSRRLEVRTFAPTRIQVEDGDGINVRELPSVQDGARVRTGMKEPFYRVEQKTGQPMEGIITNYVLEWDKYNPNQLNKIWAVRWVKDESINNGGLGRLEFMAVFDREDGGCLVSFTNPDVRLCRSS